VSDIPLRGTVLGFEECSAYALRNTFDDASPFRILASLEEPLVFLVVNPFVVKEDYNLEIDDTVADNLGLTSGNMQNVAVVCVARKLAEGRYVVNLRSPLVINTVEGRFQQVILQNETYDVDAPFAIDTFKKAEK
jgi:flagellar assembly factor FliW